MNNFVLARGMGGFGTEHVFCNLLYHASVCVFQFVLVATFMYLYCVFSEQTYQFIHILLYCVPDGFGSENTCTVATSFNYKFGQ